MLDFKRIKTMRLRLGRASQIIKTDKFLPFFRNRQIRYPEEFEKSVEIASKKRDPQRYLATVWNESNIEKSIRWLRSLIADGAAKANEFIWRKIKTKIKEEKKLVQKENRQKILDLYKTKQIFEMRR